MFKVGDKVFDNERGYGEGVIKEIDEHNGDLFVYFNERRHRESYTKEGRWVYCYPITLFKKEEKMKTYTLEQFKEFATEIEAYENGEQIQALYIDEWRDCVPKWDVYSKYRVKPKLSREEITANWVNKNNLKIGDKVKVLKGFEDDVYGISKGRSDSCINKVMVVDKISSIGVCFESNTRAWEFPVECLEKVKEEYIPFTLEDRNLFMGKLINNKEFKEFFIVTYANKEKAGFDGSYYEYEELLDNYEFEDGTPFGKLKQ